MMKSISIIGAGTMGQGIAQVYAQAGYPVSLYDLNDSLLSRAAKQIDANLSLCVSEGLIAEDDKLQCMNLITYTDTLSDAVRNADFITEAIPEVIQLKQGLFSTLESLVDDRTIIASNTSSLPFRELIQATRHPERFIMTHFFNPAHLVPLVEVVGSETTSPSVMETTLLLMKQIGKSPVRLKKDVPGFIANRLQAAVMREVLHLLNLGVADAADIDLALKAGQDFAGPFWAH